jgi:hypothetical protein
MSLSCDCADWLEDRSVDLRMVCLVEWMESVYGWIAVAEIRMAVVDLEMVRSD